jgi:membrane associated rhomboid family serine protease
MVLPLYDDNPFTKPTVPVVTWGLIAINVLVFLLQEGAPEETVQWMTVSFGFTPSAFAHDAPQAGPLPPALTLLTSMFIHGGWGHLLGNMLYLFIFGDDIEEALGRLRFIVFYLAGGVIATLGYYALDVHSGVTLIGASGAISAILSAYLMLRPCAKVTALVLRVIVRVRAYWVIGGWIMLQLVSLVAGEKDGVAYMAHGGGLVAGVVLFVLMRPDGVSLFECMDHDKALAPATVNQAGSPVRPG